MNLLALILLTFVCGAAFSFLISLVLKKRRSHKKEWFPHSHGLDEFEFKVLSEAIPQIVWTADVLGQIIYCNNRWYEFTGIPKRNPPHPKGWVDVIHPDDLIATQSAWAQCVELGVSFETNCRFRSGKDGSFRWFLIRGIPLRDRQGHIIYWFGTCTDIHDQKSVEEELRFRVQMENLIVSISKNLMKASGDIEPSIIRSLEKLGLFVGVERSYIIQYGNQGKVVKEVYEWSKDGVPRLKHWIEGMRADEYPWMHSHFSNNRPLVIRDIRQLPPEAAVDRIKLRGVLSKLSVPIFRDNELVGSLGFECSSRTINWSNEVVDLLQITSEIFMNAILRAQAEIAHIESAEILRQSNAELEQFAYISSHDLKEPLRTVSLYVELIEKRFGEKLGPLGREYVTTAINAARRMQALIYDILSYSRTSRLELVYDYIPADEIVGMALDNLERSIRESHARVIFSSLPIVYADRFQLMQVFQNLISNAIKYRGREAPVIKIEVEKFGKAWRFAIQDNGIGIDSRFFGKIFRIFQRLEGPTEGEGTGIGLALAKKVIERHGGKIWVDSIPGRGSTFYFTLPDKRDVVTEEMSVANLVSSEPTSDETYAERR